MSLPIHVDAYSGYRTNERPQSFTLDEDTYDIATVEDRWYEPDAEYFKVRTTGGKTCILRYESQGDVWTLQSGFDGDELLARPGIEVVTVDAAKIREAESKIEGCEHCHPDDAELLFDWILEKVTGRSGMVDFMMVEMARCPNCKREVTEKTLVEWDSR